MAKIIGVDHLTFAVKDLKQRMAVFEGVFGAKPLFELMQGDATAISFEMGGKFYNFVSDTSDGKGAFAEFLRIKGEGLHHIGFAVDDLDGFRSAVVSSGHAATDWELEADKETRDELMIDEGPFPTVLQIVRWDDNRPPSTDQWVSRAVKYSGESKIKDLRHTPSTGDLNRITQAKILDLDHVCFAVKDRDQIVSFVENVLGGRFLATHTRGGETASTFMEIGGYVHNFVTAPENGTSFFADFLRKKGAALHHIGVSVDKLDAFKYGMAANEIKIPKWELEGSQEIRDEVLIGTRQSPTVIQVIEWADAPPTSADEWMALEEKYTG